MDRFRIIEPVGTSVDDVEWVVAIDNFTNYDEAYDAIAGCHSHSRLQFLAPNGDWVDA